MLALECNCRNSGGNTDEGDINAVSRFPITQLKLGDLDSSTEYIYYTLGPLVCDNAGKSSLFNHYLFHLAYNQPTV